MGRWFQTMCFYQEKRYIHPYEKDMKCQQMTTQGTALPLKL
jgi:hypothetical protein